MAPLSCGSALDWEPRPCLWQRDCHNPSIASSDQLHVARPLLEGYRSDAARYTPARISIATVIAQSALIGGGRETKITFPGKKLKTGGDYSFFCTFPGHSTLLKGKLAVTK